MRVALLTQGIYPFQIGGMQKHSYYLAKYLARSGVIVDVFTCPYFDYDDLNNYFTNDELRKIQFRVIDFPRYKYFPGHYVIESYIFSKRIGEIIQKEYDGKINFIYAQGFTGWFILNKNKIDNNIPKVGVNFHGLNMFQKPANLKSSLERFLFRMPVKHNINKADQVYSIGGKLTKILERNMNNHEKIREIPIGIEEDWILSSERKIKKTLSQKRFIFIGRYERIKGIHELNTALNKIVTEKDFKFYFIGPIPQNLRLLDKKIYYYGLVKDQKKIKDILDHSDVLVLPSWSEGMPTVVLEAMARGNAILATDVGAVSKLVDDSNGWIISPGSSKELKEKLADVIDTPHSELLLKKKASIKKVAQEFTWDKIVDKTIKEMFTDTKK